ncbi:MAG TPA: FAD-dependent oxidoreductase [Terracidiphilus sp.]
MENRREEFDQNQPARFEEAQVVDWTGTDFRPDLAFPTLTEEMVERIRPFGHEETFPADEALYSYGDRHIDMFVVLEGGVDIFLSTSVGAVKIYCQHRKFDFTGELNLLNSQRVVVEARTSTKSRLLRIDHGQLRQLMRAEGDIANLIVQAAVWRRIGIIRDASTGVVLMGQRNDAQTTLLHRFFVRNSYPYRIEEVAPDSTGGTARDVARLPAVRLSDGRVLHQPTIPELADELGITELPDPELIYDVAVVGAGPSGLAAAVYAASEGLSTIVIEGLAPGGQAGTSSKIENYLGFPTGIGGQQLASRAQLQALKFGVQFAISRETVTVQQVDGIHKLLLAGGIPVCARAVVVASGAQYRKLTVENFENYENRGLYYAATPMESILCRDKDVIIVGGGNSAGQAAMFLSGIARHVYHVVRGPSLAATMSQYLVSRIESSSRISLCTNCEIVALEGRPTLQSVTWVNRSTGERTQKAIEDVFVMIGAEPNTGWLYGTVRLDKKGFILTGEAGGFESTPYATSVPGIYAVGDVRANSVKRVASAVGEGSVVISDVHRYLANERNHVSAQPDSPLAALRAAGEATEAKV